MSSLAERTHAANGAGDGYNLAVTYMLTGRVAESEREVSEAEKAGFRVNPNLKQDIANRKNTAR